MFKIEPKESTIELFLNNSEKHAETGVTLKSLDWTFTHDEWLLFVKEVAAFNPEAEAEPDVTEEPEEELKGQADLIYDLLEEKGPLTYPEIGNALGVSPKRASNIVSTMIRDGVDLKREGKPRKVSLN